jgi:hypothetical protein
VAKFTPWGHFRSQVEGRPGAGSCKFEDGELYYCVGRIPKGAEPDLKLLADVLRSKIQLPDDIRQWLADLLDPEAGSRFQFRKLEKRKGGEGPDPIYDFELIEYVNDQTRLGALPKNIIADAVKKFGMSPSSVRSRLATYKKARDEHDRINRENEEFEK